MRNKFRILHLEDVPTDAELVARELQKSGIDFEHVVIDTREQYEEALQSFKPDIILCDHSLPAFNSTEALRIKRMRKLHIPFILITATMSDEVALDLVREGADDYILKDSMKRLPHAVRNALDKYGLEWERKSLIDRVIERETASQEVLKQLTNKLLLANKAALIGVWDYFVEDGRIICDDYVLSLYGRKQDDFDGSFESWLQFLHPDDRGPVLADVRAAWDNGTDLEMEFRAVWPDGSTYYIRSLGVIEYDATGRATRMVGINKDITERRMASQVLMESEERYRAFFENSMDAILLTAPDGRIMAANAAACRIFEKTEAEIIAGGRAGVVDLTDARLPALLEQRQRTGNMRGELTFLRKDGSRFPADVTSSIFKDINGEDRTSMIIRDITGWKAAQDRLMKSEAGLKEAQNLAQLGSWNLDVITDTLEWSDEVYRIFEIAPEDFTGKLESFMQQVVPDDRAFVMEQYGKSVSTKSPIDFTHRITAGGQVKHVHERLQNFYDEKGTHVRTTGTIQDVTVRMRAEMELKDTSTALQLAVNGLNKIMDSSLDVICTINEEGRFIKVSAASAQVWGFAPEELVGRQYRELVYHEDAAHTEDVTSLVRQGIDFTNFENRFVRKDGTVVPLVWSVSWDADEKIMHGIAKDVTEKKRLDDAFENERLRFAALFEQAPSCIGVFKGPQHVFEMANPFYLELTGRKEIIGKPVRTVFPELEGQGVFELLDKVYSSGAAISGKEVAVKIDRNGTGELTKLYSNFIYQAYSDKDGQVDGIFFFSVDVTEQVIARKKAEESQRNYSLLFHSSPLPQFICAKESLRFLEVNGAALDQYGYAREEFLGLSYDDLQDDDNYRTPGVQPHQSNIGSGPLNHLTYHLNKAGQRMIVEMKTSEIRYNNAQCLLVTVSDLTQEIRMQEKMTELQVKAQKKVTQAHIRGQEKERAYIGRELHDNINQQLTTAKLYLDLARDKEDLRLSLLQKSEDVIQKTINEIRNLSKGFMLPTQAEMSLEETLTELINTYSEFENRAFHLKCHECLLDMREEMKLMFYRIVQEQLNNISKYSGCRNVWIEFEPFDNCIYLMIKDDGKGFDVQAKRKGIGLSNIKGRLELHHGELDINSAPGQGCTIHILVPLDTNESEGEKV